MNYRDFKTVGDDYVRLCELKIGDYFMEDTYPEVYRLKDIREATHDERSIGMPGTIYVAVDVNYSDGHLMEFAEVNSGSICLVKLEPRN